MRAIQDVWLFSLTIQGDLEMIRMLHEKGASLAAVDDQGRSLLDVATSPQVREYLLNASKPTPKGAAGDAFTVGVVFIAILGILFGKR